jgi:hypothetical protein
MQEPDGKNLRDLYNSIKNKPMIWAYMRYFTFFYDFMNDSTHEIILPRSGQEYFTYRSEKFWAKIIYGIIHLQENPYTIESKLSEAIHNGSRINLIKYWYPILRDKKYVDNPKIKAEIKYYLYSHDMIINIINNSTDDIKRITKLYNEDTKIARILYSMREYTTVDKQFCYKLLIFINRNNQLIIIDKFYEYLTRPINNCSIETENKTEMINIFHYYTE